MDQQAAVDALEELGLSTYEAKVFIALVTLGVGSASDVARVVDVPRSQVYGAADRLEERGLVAIQQSSPIQYRAVDLEEASAQLRRRFERAESQAFDYLRAVEREGEPEGQQEGVWTVEGFDTVTTRITRLVEEAESSVLFATEHPPLATDEVVEALAAARDRGLSVQVVGGDRGVLDRFDADGVETHELTEFRDWESRSGRLLIADGATVLLSVVDDGVGEGDAPAETAIWSAETAFAGVFIRLIEGRLGAR
ncbi:TrmB family transcriptional regulator [Halomarina litorea]|uniref:TrmB family transcriptional regulator n=1 Tax=Halomarina litorea TaxID=2961595 RepID=UPI0020C1D660|nr:helix-turn-helix domain-containing protein [Halomarina sp. BCD28]